VDASSAESLEKTLITRLKLIDDQLDIVNVEEAKNLLANPKGRLTCNWLIIMDNADNSAVKPQDFIPSCDHGCVLITSRNAALSDLNPDGYVGMGVMSREEAVEALLSAALGSKFVARSEGRERSRLGQVQSISRTKQDEECAGVIVDELGRLPLAVIQAACYIKKQKCLHEYSNLLKTSRNKLLRWPASVQRDTLQYAHSTYAAFDTTLSALFPRALKFLGVISFVNFSDFPKSLIGSAASLQFGYQPHDLLDRPPEYQLSVNLLREIFCPEGYWDPMVLDSLLEELQGYSIVTLVAVSTTVTLRFHPLLHGWANDRLSTPERIVFRSAAVRLLACGTNSDDSHLWPYLSSHIERFSLTTDELHVNDRAAFTAILRSNRQYSKSVDIWGNIHTIVHRVHGERHLRTTRVALWLADAYGHNGDWQRMESVERKIVEIRKETLGGAHTETLNAMANLARTCKDYGKRFDEALNIELEVLRMQREVSGPKHRLIVLALSDLAATYRYQHRHQESQALLVEALEMISSLLGRAHPATIRVMQKLASCYVFSGDSEAAMKLDQEIIELQRTVRGDTHVDTLTAMAKLYYNQGQADAAERIWRDLVEGLREAVGGHRDHILQSLSGLARSNYQQSRFTEAEVLWREVFLGWRETLGAEHAETVGAQRRLFDSIFECKRYGEAEALGRDLVTVMRRTLGEQHVDTLYTRHRLAICIHNQQREAEAEVLWREIVTDMREILGAEHVDTVDAQCWLFNSLYRQKRYNEAEALGQDNIMAMRRTLGAKHAATLSALSCLARCIYKQNRFTEAEVLWREVVAGRQHTLGAKHEDTLDSQMWLDRAIRQSTEGTETTSPTSSSLEEHAVNPLENLSRGHPTPPESTVVKTERRRRRHKLFGSWMVMRGLFKRHSDPVHQL
jgi:tetratricopeptide (TPR) repeat protein